MQPVPKAVYSRVFHNEHTAAHSEIQYLDLTHCSQEYNHKTTATDNL